MKKKETILNLLQRKIYILKTALLISPHPGFWEYGARARLCVSCAKLAQTWKSFGLIKKRNVLRYGNVVRFNKGYVGPLRSSAQPWLAYIHVWGVWNQSSYRTPK